MGVEYGDRDGTVVSMVVLISSRKLNRIGVHRGFFSCVEF